MHGVGVVLSGTLLPVQTGLSTKNSFESVPEFFTEPAIDDKIDRRFECEETQCNKRDQVENFELLTVRHCVGQDMSHGITDQYGSLTHKENYNDADEH